MEITQNTILKLIFRQGTNDDKNQIVLTSGEPGYTTDTQRLFIGDGFTSGGILVGNKFKGLATDLTLLAPAEIGDYAFDTDSNSFYVVTINDGLTLSDWTKVGGVYTGSDYIFVDPANNQISLNALSAGIFDPDALGFGLTLDISGRLAVTYSNFTFTDGLTAFANGLDVTGQAINPLSGDVVVRVGQLSAGMFSYDAVSDYIVLNNGRISLSSTLPYQYISTNTITVSGSPLPLQAFNGNDVDITNQPVNPLSSSIRFSLRPLSAGMITSDALGSNIVLDSNGKIALSSHIPFQYVSNNTITVLGSALKAVNGSSVDVTNQAINPLSSSIVISLLPLSAGMISSDALDGNIVLNNGRIALSSTIPFQYVSTNTLTISSGLEAFIGNTNITNQAVNPLSSNIVVRAKTVSISAGMITSDALGANIVLDSNSRISLSTTIPFQFVSTKTISVSNGVAMFVQNSGGGFTPAVSANPLSANILLMGTDVLANYAGLSGQVLLYSRNLLSVIRLSAGDYDFRYNLPTSNVYPIVQVYGNVSPGLLARAVNFNLSSTRVNIISALDFNVKRDANVIFKLSY